MHSALRQAYDSQGFVVIPSLIQEDRFGALKQATERVIQRTRSGNWPYRRPVGNQFPPFDNSNADSWGVQHVMHPDLGEPAFAEWYTSDRLVNTVKELLGCSENDLQMELFNLLINPSTHSFALRWHRDDVREDVTEADEQEALNVSHYGIQWNTALYEDDCLYVVPGSHKSPRTPAQRAQSSTLQYPEDPIQMPGAVRLKLQPGETVFYNSNILHCAKYTTVPRATLHACMGSVQGGSARARNVLQHGLDWMTEARFKESLNERSASMLERLIMMKSSAGVVGFSLKN